MNLAYLNLNLILGSKSERDCGTRSEAVGTRGPHFVAHYMNECIYNSYKDIHIKMPPYARHIPTDLNCILVVHSVNFRGGGSVVSATFPS